MAKYLVLENAQANGGTLKAGSVVDSASTDIAGLLAAGVQLFDMTIAQPSDMARAVADLRRRQVKSDPLADSLFAAVAAYPEANDAAIGAGIVWRPGAPAQGNIAPTWATVEALLGQTSGPVSIFIDGSLGLPTVPASVSYDLLGRVTFRASRVDLSGNTTRVFMEDGAELLNPYGANGITFYGAPTTRPFIRITLPGLGIIFREGAGVAFDVGATVPAIRVSADFTETAFFEGGTLDNSNAPTVPLITLDPTLTFFIFPLINQIGTSGFPANTLVGGGAGTVVINFLDSSIPPLPTQGGFAGVWIENRYQFVAGMTPAAGTTAQRPTAPKNGEQFFDSDLNQEIVWNGTAWVIQRFVATIGDGVSTVINVVHGMNSYDVQVEVYEADPPRATILCDVERPDPNSIDLGFLVAPALNELKVVVTQ